MALVVFGSVLTRLEKLDYKAIIRGKTEIISALSANTLTASSSPNHVSFRGSHFAFFPHIPAQKQTKTTISRHVRSIQYRVGNLQSHISPICSMQKWEDFDWAMFWMISVVKMRERTQSSIAIWTSRFLRRRRRRTMWIIIQKTQTHVMSLMRRSPVVKLLLLKDSSPNMVRSVGAQHLMMYMAGQLLQMSSKWSWNHKVCCDQSQWHQDMFWAFYAIVTKKSHHCYDKPWRKKCL